MADNVMTFRLVVREIALEQGVYATFMPKPIAGVQGSGMHTHLSLFEGDVNALNDPERRIPPVENRSILHRRPAQPRPEITAVTNQLVNSYKRLIVGDGRRRPSSPGPKQTGPRDPGPRHELRQGSSVRIEYRSPDPACNPYRRSLYSGRDSKASTRATSCRPRPPPTSSHSRRPSARRKALQELPQSLAECPRRREQPEFVAETLGEHIFEWFLRNKRAEWPDYKTQVTQFEPRRCSPESSLI